MTINKRIIPALLATCLMTYSLTTPALAATKKTTSSTKKTTSSRKNELFKIDSKELSVAKTKTGTTYWNVSPETFIKAFESVFDGALDISSSKKANKNVFSYSSDAVTLSLHATSNSYSESNLTKVVIDIKQTKDKDNFTVYGLLVGGLVTIFSQYDNVNAAKIVKALNLTSDKNDFSTVNYTYKTAKYNIKYTDKKVTLTITPIAK